MRVTGKIVGEGLIPLQGASIEMYRTDGVVLPGGTMTDYLGDFVIDNPALTPHGSTLISVTHVGYEQGLIDPSFFVNKDYYMMRITEMEPVVITPGSKMNTGWLALLIGASVLYFINRK